MAKNKKKEKTVYIDVGSSIADMSALSKGLSRDKLGGSRRLGGRPTFKECFKTYIEAVKMMIKPMFITIGIITIAFLIIYFIL